jgi:hypothetical protein
VKSRFQSLPFKCNLQRYTVGQVLAEALGDKAGCNRMGRAVAAVAGGEVGGCTSSRIQ